MTRDIYYDRERNEIVVPEDSGGGEVIFRLWNSHWRVKRDAQVVAEKIESNDLVDLDCLDDVDGEDTDLRSLERYRQTIDRLRDVAGDGQVDVELELDAEFAPAMQIRAWGDFGAGTHVLAIAIDEYGLDDIAIVRPVAIDGDLALEMYVTVGRRA